MISINADMVLPDELVANIISQGDFVGWVQIVSLDEVTRWFELNCSVFQIRQFIIVVVHKTDVSVELGAIEFPSYLFEHLLTILKSKLLDIFLLVMVKPCF